MHVVSAGGRAARQYSVRLTGPSSQRTYDSAAFVASAASSTGDLTIASLHYNGLFESADDLAPSAVLVAQQGTSTAGSAALVQLGATHNSSSAWGMFETFPAAASALGRRSSGSEDCGSGAAVRKASAKKDESRSSRAKSGDRSRKSKSRESSKSKSKQRTSKAQAAKDGVVIINDRRCRVVSRSNGSSTSESSSTKTTASSSSTSTSSSVGVGAAAAKVLSTGSVANTGTAPAAAVATSVPPTLTGQVVGAQTADVAASTPAVNTAQAAASDVPSATLAASAEQASESAFQLPGRQLSVLPIGLGVTGGVSVLALGIVGFVSWERRRYRKQFRSRKMCVGAATGSG